MKYELTRDQILEFSKLVFEKAINSYLDLKEVTCESLLDKFLEDKKSIMPLTHLSISPIVTVDGTNFYGGTNVVVTNSQDSIFSMP
jgi:hypothetical protein